MLRILDIENWKRKEHFYFFKNYDIPFFSICADVDASRLLTYSRESRLSFFICSLYLSIKAANCIEEFRYRIHDEKVIVHDVIHAGSTVLNSDETFSFCYFDYSSSFVLFNKDAAKKLAKYAAGYKSFEPQEQRDDLIYYSVIPWVSFNGYANARKSKTDDSTPKIVFGKYHDNVGLIRMPVSVEVHHALMDGIHVGKFFGLFQDYLMNPENALRS